MSRLHAPIDSELLHTLGGTGFHNWLNRFLLDQQTEPVLFPWFQRLSPQERESLCSDLELILSEPEETGEPLDVREIGEILSEYAEYAGWSGSPLAQSLPAEDAAYAIDIRPKEFRALRSAAPGVRRAVEEILTQFLAVSPNDPARLRNYNVKKLADRAIRQIDLPDDFRLRYLVDDPNRIVYVVYLGPHPQGQADGRERAVRALTNRQRNERL
jgi:mRNA-degrading endonuclease RelE of RelBE toxin-antitoxin system